MIMGKFVRCNLRLKHSDSSVMFANLNMYGPDEHSYQRGNRLDYELNYLNIFIPDRQ